MDELTISLIIPAYNEEKYIGECLKYAILNSKGKFLEIIVIDNASSDKTAEIASSYAGVRVVREDRKGVTRARQRGYLEAHGDILAYIDADTRMPEGWVETVVSEFSKNKNLVCLSGPNSYYDISNLNNLCVKVFWQIFAMPVYYAVGYMVLGANFAIKKDTLDQMDGFDTSIEFYGDDTDIARKASKYGKVKFKSSFTIETSGRRLKNQGVYITGLVYAKNFFSEVFYHKPSTKDYQDYR